MHSVDFLPKHYRRQQADRRTHVWLALALAIHGGLLGVVATYQYLTWQSVQRRHGQLRTQYEQAQLANNRLTELQRQLTETNDLAELYTYLRHPWPRTQVVAAVIEQLPVEVSLSEVTIRREAIEKQNDRHNRRRSGNVPKDAEQKPLAPRQALGQLRSEIDASRTIVRVRGRATDNSALHRSIATMNNSRLFTKVDLESLDSMDEDDSPDTAMFELRLELLPGYGQPGGPDAPSSARLASSP